MDHRKNESSGIKTHQEILELIQSIKSIEEKVKNPEPNKDFFEPEITIPEIEPPPRPPTERGKKREIIEPAEDIPLKKKEKRKRIQQERIQQRKEEIEEKIKKSHSFWKKEKTNALETKPNTEENQPPEPIIPKKVTFTLQLDSEGNLIGLPLKRSSPEMDTLKEVDEEPVKGIKGKLSRIVSRMRSNKSSEEESTVGIGGRIKGIFKRSSKE